MKCKICGSCSRNHNCVTVNNIQKKIWNIRNGFHDDMIRRYITETSYDDIKKSMDKLFIENMIAGRHNHKVQFYFNLPQQEWFELHKYK
jgi:hypothetical protein